MRGEFDQWFTGIKNKSTWYLAFCCNNFSATCTTVLILANVTWFKDSCLILVWRCFDYIFQITVLRPFFYRDNESCNNLSKCNLVLVCVMIVECEFFWLNYKIVVDNLRKWKYCITSYSIATAHCVANYSSCTGT